YLNPAVTAALHVRRAGWFSAHQLGMQLLEKARQAGVQLLADRVSVVHTRGGRVSAVTTAGGQTIATNCLVNAAGPLLNQVAGLTGQQLPVQHERHLKLAFRDVHGVLDRAAPLVIWAGEQTLDLPDDERAGLQDDPELRFLTGRLPAGIHTRPEGGAESPIVIALWEYRDTRLPDGAAPVFPLPDDPLYADVVQRGLEQPLPGMRAYRDRLVRPAVDGGYYTCAPDNRPLIGPLPLPGSYALGALSGYGLMAAAAAGELLAAYLDEAELPGYAAACHPARFDDPGYLALAAALTDSGQL
ncbi:MAG: FAD-dependent oxidoreductase, partial [Chloroflexota bacterium]